MERTGTSQDKYPLYLNAFQNTVKDYANNQDRDADPYIKKIIFYGVKLVNSEPKAETYDDALSSFQLASVINDLIGQLTPVEFMNIFPVEKDFKGDKFGVKDYFSTMEYVNTLNMNEAIGDKVMDFLWEYQNWEIHHFNVEIMCHLSALRRFEGYLDPMEEFMASQGMETPNTFKNSKGEALYVRHGKPEIIQKQNHLKTIK